MRVKSVSSAVLIAILALSFVVSASSSTQWYTDVSEDEMTGTKSWYAFSPNTGPTKTMDFPYGNVSAWLGVGCNGEDEWPFIGFSFSPNLINTTIKNGYNLIYTRIKWDDEVEDVTLAQKWNDRFIFFADEDDASVISKIANSKTMLLELDWFGQGKVYFRFSLEGASTAISEMRSACGS